MCSQNTKHLIVTLEQSSLKPESGTFTIPSKMNDTDKENDKGGYDSDELIKIHFKNAPISGIIYFFKFLIIGVFNSDFNPNG